MKNSTVSKLRPWGAVLLLLATASCSKNDGPGGDNNVTGDPQFMIAAALSGGSGGSGGTGQGTTYFLQVGDVESGETTIVDNGIIQANTFTHWAESGTNAAFGFLYGQGNDYSATGFELSAEGKLQRTGGDILIVDGFTTVGSTDRYVVGAGRTVTLANDKKAGKFNFIDFENNNVVLQKYLESENFQGTGLEASFVGVVDAGNNEFFTGVILTDGDPNMVYVAKVGFDANSDNMVVKNFYTDNRLSYSAGQMRSARYGMIGNDNNGNTYVFSGSYSAATTKKAGALKINSGANNFDADYYFDIETKSGGHRFRKVFPISEDYFLLEMYNETGAPGSQSPATQYAIVKMSTQSFTWVTGIPAKDEITNAGWPYIHNGKIYIGITTPDEDPTVYVIDGKTGVGKAGIVVKGGATSIPRVAYLTPQDN
ncbi:DUF4374 domain-containing protein [Sphingobacterium corticibacterium]|uniref:DUF4374 domain-containing protein n=1 Tax=Sphingobacterium corticibacterium TaxID=2484746 RepID=A0A4Q6XFR8_9SPHI|nr:DUF4374 domain-containing protein [Sphingobacterium corticibacterium]RZF57443.1 DUF4374 domain-containing protein [Sphingobacterium corticibacterium]